MKTYTKHGFLYLELAIQQDKPSAIIVSDKESIMKRFDSEAARETYIAELKESMKKIGAEICNIPSSAIWYNPNTVLSVESLENRYLILEFPWNIWKKINFTSMTALQDAYATVLDQLSWAGGPGDLSSYLLKSEAAETYLKIRDSENFASKSSVNDVADRVTETEGDISALETSMGTAQGDISSLQTDVGSAQGDISSLQTDVGGMSSSISDLEDKTQNLSSDGTITSIEITNSATFANAPVSSSNVTFDNLSSTSIPNKTQVLSIVEENAPKVFTNASLFGSASSGDADYPYLNTFTTTGIDSTYMPTVILSREQSESGIWDAYAETVSNGVTIKTKEALDISTKIPTIVCQKIN